MINKGRMIKMSKAYNIPDLLDSLQLIPLDEDDIKDFYVDTTDARGEDAAGRIAYVLRNSHMENKKILFAGHIGSGKSTELIKLAETLEKEYFTIYFSISDYVNVGEMSAVDIVFTMLKCTLDKINSSKTDIDRNALNSIIDYWKSEEIITSTEEDNFQIDGETGLSFSLFDFLSAKISGMLQQSSKSKNETILKVEKTFDTFIRLINNFIESLKQSLDRKKLLLIVDDLDKIDEKTAYNIFKEHCVTLTSINANVIYTFPVFMHYTTDYRYISMYFDESIILSIIMTKTMRGDVYKKGIETLREIVFKRADDKLFGDDCVDFAIMKSGGSIRILLTILRSSSIYAGLRYLHDKTSINEQVITMEDIKRAYREYKNSAEKSFNKKHLPLLKEIHSHKRVITDADNVLVMELFKTFAVIEYNCERWCDLNPAVLDYLVELKEIEE